MAVIEGEVVIGRPVEVVFDYVADQRNEPRYNPRMVRAEKVTRGRSGRARCSARPRRRWGVPPKCGSNAPSAIHLARPTPGTRDLDQHEAGTGSSRPPVSGSRARPGSCQPGGEGRPGPL